MPSLKSLRIRINSVKSTQKITKAMKMVAASKLRRAQEHAEAARPYAERMERMLGEIAAAVAGQADAPRLLAGGEGDGTHLLIVATSDRGLCGGFNSSIVRRVRRQIAELSGAGTPVKLLCLGRKGRDQLRREFDDLILATIDEIDKGGIGFDKAEAITTRLLAWFEEGAFDTCTVVYNRYKSVISQEVTAQRLIPFGAAEDDDGESPADEGPGAVHEYEPDEAEILADLLPRNLAVQIYRALLESSASEQAARMTAMDNASRNAGEMIDKLTLFYNRSRQAVITKELIEIVSGAEAL